MFRQRPKQLIDCSQSSSSHLLFVSSHINAGVVEGGGLSEERSDDSHGGRDGLRVSERGPETHQGVGRPGHQEHDDHQDGHLENIKTHSALKVQW